MSTEQEKIMYIHQNPNKGESKEPTPGVQFSSFQEVCLDYEEKKLFYTTKMEIIDMSCCGTGNSGLVTVYGFVDQWKFRKSDLGDSITYIEPIRDENTKNEISQIIQKKELISHIDFK